MCRRTHARRRIFPDSRIRSCGGHSLSVGTYGAQYLPYAQEHYPIGTPDVRVSRVVRGPPAVLTVVATGQRITEDPLLPFERLLGHPLGVALLMQMTVYPTEESCLAKLEAGGVRCTKCRGDQVKRRSKRYWWCAACGKQSNPAKVKAGKVHCTHCDGDRVTGRPGHHWWCATCRRQFSSLTGTPMEATHLPLRLWTAAIFLKLLSRDTIRAKEVAELLGVARATAGSMLDALRTKVAR